VDKAGLFPGPARAFPLSHGERGGMYLFAAQKVEVEIHAPGTKRGDGQVRWDMVVLAWLWITSADQIGSKAMAELLAVPCEQKEVVNTKDVLHDDRDATLKRVQASTQTEKICSAAPMSFSKVQTLYEYVVDDASLMDPVPLGPIEPSDEGQEEEALEPLLPPEPELWDLPSFIRDLLADAVGKRFKAKGRLKAEMKRQEDKLGVLVNLVGSLFECVNDGNKIGITRPTQY